MSKKEITAENIHLLKLPSETVEEYIVVKKIKKLIKNGVNPEEIAVLYRNNADSKEISNLLAKNNIAQNIILDLISVVYSKISAWSKTIDHTINQ